MFGERLLRARKAAGFSQKDLADDVGVSANMIKKYEKGQSMPDSSRLVQLAKSLDVRSEYFFRPQNPILDKVEYRKKSRIGKKRLDTISHIILDQIERRLELESLFPKSPVSVFQLPEGLPNVINDLNELEGIAVSLHEQWNLGFNPIPDLVDLFESKGIRVFLIAAGQNDLFDGLLAQVNDIPVIAIGECWPGDRQRFTLAHELGHLLLEGRLAKGIKHEKACDRFAGAFLFPAPAVESSLGSNRTRLPDREIYALKQEYGLSMLGIIYRAYNLGIISESYFKSCFFHYRAHGWIKMEPGEQLAPERARIFNKMVFHAFGEGYIGESKAAELLNMKRAEFRKFRRIEGPDADSCK